MSAFSEDRTKLSVVLLTIGSLCIVIYFLGLLFKKIQSSLGISDAIAGLLILCCWLALHAWRIFREGRHDETQKLFIAPNTSSNKNDYK
jgi:type VI protein secretion system component VasK